jgi:hypothetical protein
MSHDGNIDILTLSPAKLLKLHADVSEALVVRGITRSANNPTGDLAELLFCEAFGWTQENNSKKGYDAFHGNIKYQIKGRRLDNGKGSRQLSALRELKKKHFDYVAAVIFNCDYTVWKAAIIPYEIVAKEATRVNHNNSHRFLLRDRIWNEDGVKDVTDILKRVVLK